MNITMMLSIASVIYIGILSFIYFMKENIKTKETKIYSVILLSVLLGGFLEILLRVLAPVIYNYPLINDIFAKIFLVYLLFWLSLITIYNFYISVPKESFNIFKYAILGYNIIVDLFIAILPINYFYEEGANYYSYTYGPACSILTIALLILIGLNILLLLVNIKQIIRNKKYYPIVVCVIFFIIVGIIQIKNPSILLNIFVQGVVTFLMYNTIENPDIKVLDELYKNRKIIENSNQDMSNYLFKISQNIRKPVNDIIELTSSKENATLKHINNLGKHLNYLIDDALDLSNMTTKNIKLYEDKYSVHNLFNSIRVKTESSLNDKVKLEYKIAKSLPEYVYGDSVRFKQILSGIIDNAISHTQVGYLTIDISAVIKYDICRFLIEVTDTGNGISIDEINDILSLKDSEEEYDFDSNTTSLKTIKLLTNKIGGNFMVKSDKNGTTVSIALDQKIVSTEDSKISKKLDIYAESINSNKKIMVIDDDKEELYRITRLLEKKDIIVSGSLYGRDVIEKVRNKHKFDMIILDDETDTYSAYEVLKELKKNEKFDIPVIIMIDDSKDFIKLHYLKEGFAEVILKSKLPTELERITKILS